MPARGLEELAARGQQGDAAIGSLQQRVADLFLEFADSLAQWRLRHVQALCCTVEAQFFSDDDELAEQSGFEHSGGGGRAVASMHGASPASEARITLQSSRHPIGLPCLSCCARQARTVTPPVVRSHPETNFAG